MMYVKLRVLVVMAILAVLAIPTSRISATSPKSSAPGLPQQAARPFVKITSHKDEQRVPLNPIIRGKVFSKKANVWVIVHPMETDGFWVQPKATVNSDGKWRALIFIGRKGKEDSGKSFEIMAVANPKEDIARGDVLDSWPKAQAQSDTVELVRE